jgi:tungstate transport system substrate-binding protein
MFRRRKGWTALIKGVMRLSALTFIVLASVFVGAACSDDKKELILGATTSVQDPGLLDALVEAFEERSGYHVKPIVAGSGQILEQSRQGEMDVIMTHSPADEEKLIADGFATDKTEVMQNFFVIAGPGDDPAGVAEAATMEEAFQKIAEGEHRFISRGDDSGTHRREQAIWASAAIDPVGRPWYTESTTGQGQNLLVANDSDAYTLVDSSTFVSFKQRLNILEVLRDEKKPNVYSVVRLNSDNLTQVNTAAANAWLDFMTGEGQTIIAEFGQAEHGEALFETLVQ